MSQPKTIAELSLPDYQLGNAAQRQEFSQKLTESLTEFGFVILKNQNMIAPEVLSDAYSLMEDFYALPVREKRRYTNKRGGQRGYTGFGVENAKGNQTADLKEFWHVGQTNPPTDQQSRHYQNNIWPELKGFEPVFTTLYKGLEDMGLLLLDALASQIDPHSDYLRNMAINGNSILRLLHYPPIPKDAPANAMRAAAHEDINLITLLVAAKGSGLQVLTRDNQWLDIDTDPSHIIVDAGDMLAHVTGSKIPAMTHRVVNSGDLGQSRYSIPFFMHPKPNVILRPLEHFCDRPETVDHITALASLERRLREIGLME